MFIRGRFVAEMSEPEDFAVSKKICMLKVWCFFRQFVAFFLPIDLHVHVCYPDAMFVVFFHIINHMIHHLIGNGKKKLIQKRM